MNKKFLFGSFLLILLLVVVSCKTKKYTVDSYEGKRMSIGSVGGYAGIMTKYYLFENGQLFKQNKALQGASELIAFDKKLTKQLFQNYYTLGLDQLDLNDTGNMSYFIIMESDSNDKHMIKWGGNKHQPSAELNQYYDNLAALIKRNNYSLK